MRLSVLSISGESSHLETANISLSKIFVQYLFILVHLHCCLTNYKKLKYIVLTQTFRNGSATDIMPLWSSLKMSQSLSG